MAFSDVMASRSRKQREKGAFGRRWMLRRVAFGEGVDQKTCTHRIHVMVYLSTFTIKINPMQVDIPYMDPMG